MTEVPPASPRAACIESKFGGQHVKVPRAVLERWYNEPSERTLLWGNVPQKEAIPSRLPKSKSLALVKTVDRLEDAASVASFVLALEMGGSTPFEHLELLSGAVLLPLLSNQVNRIKWGEMASKELVGSFHSLLFRTSILCGHVNGKIHLPIPPIMEGTGVGGEPNDSRVAGRSNETLGADLDTKRRLAVLESAVVTWTAQIRRILKQDCISFQGFREGVYPTPDEELAFWQAKAKSLNDVFDQIGSQRVRLILGTLENATSSYCTPFARLCREVFAAREEANDNEKYLRTMEPWIYKIKCEENFSRLGEAFRPLLHTIVLVWKHSNFYNEPSRLVGIMRQVCNLLIDRARRYVSGEQLFRLVDEDEANVAVQRLRTILSVCASFKDNYANTSAAVALECPNKSWKIQKNTVFFRLDSFMERCDDMLDLTQTVVHFSKISKTDIGNTDGERLTVTLHKISEDFQAAITVMKGLSYDVMAIGDGYEGDFDGDDYRDTANSSGENGVDGECQSKKKSFCRDYATFCKAIKDIEWRLSSVICRALDDCSTVYGRLQILGIFSAPLLGRPMIQNELESKQIEIIQNYGRDLQSIQDLFFCLKNRLPTSNSNLPPMAAALTWGRGLLERANIPMEFLSTFDESLLNREEAREVFKMHTFLTTSLLEYETHHIKTWEREVEAASGKKLSLPLLQRLETRKLITNFDPALVRLLREAKYFLLLGLSVPAQALKIFQSTEVLRSRTGNINLIVNTHNAILDRLLPVERPLVMPYLSRFDVVVECGITSLTWKSDGIDEYLSECMNQITKVDGILVTIKNNFATIQDIIASWNSPLFERKNKPVEKEDYEHSCKNFCSKRMAAIKDSGKQIHSLVRNTNKVLCISKASADWKSYLSFINALIIEGLSAAVVTSLEFLLRQMDSGTISRTGRLPMLRVVMDLQRGSSGAGGRKDVEEHPYLGFTPRLARIRSNLVGGISSKSQSGVRELVDDMIESMMQISTLVKRLDSDGTYMKELHVDPKVKGYISLLHGIMEDNESQSLLLQRQFEEYSHLWSVHLPSYFSTFASEATITTESGAVILNLNKYEALIEKCRKVQDAVATFESFVDIGWLRIDTNPAKQQISMCASTWIDTIKTYVLNSVVKTMSVHHNFVAAVTKGLEMEVGRVMPDTSSEGKVATEGDAKGSSQAIPEAVDKGNLMQVMSVMRDVRKRADVISEMFGPQRDCLHFLRTHGVDVVATSIAGKNIQDVLEEAPVIWDSIVKRSFKRKEEILPMQLSSVEALKSDLDEFYLSIRSFRCDFRAKGPFDFVGDCSNAYEMLDIYVADLQELEEKVTTFEELEELFELQRTSYPEVGQTWRELKHLKHIWDFKAMISVIFESWKSTLWKDLGPEELEMHVKRLRKQLKIIANNFIAMRGWQVYRNIDASLEEMAVALPLVAELQADSIRSRHWAALARVCNVKAVDPSSNDQFALEDMLQLRLHEHSESIEEIVEAATKELKIERKLEEIDQLWSETELDYVPYGETHVVLPRPSEDLVEAMEAHQMDLQGIYGMGKFMTYFEDRVIAWQFLLRKVDETLQMWITVSRLWSSLEPIFLGSADIRSQLPDDTKRFEKIDSDFKDLTKEAALEPNVVTVCSGSGMSEALSGMRERLEVCQKSLNEYLDVKKKIFPRFYFVSSVALLDMLANGTCPAKITKYLGDCYDALADLRFVPEPGSNSGTDKYLRSQRTVDAMIAKDGEEIELAQPFTMEGELEHYLNELTEAMRTCLKSHLSTALEKAVNWEMEVPRHEWLFGYPAQLCITGSQIYWTDETTLALEEYEAGQEDAVKRYLQVCNDRLSALIKLVLGDLTAADRTKIISLITMDVHSRDVVAKLISQKTEGPSAFAWQQQLRFEWDQSSKAVNVKICDFAGKYFYEWVGNTGRLVITPLTDRCYITLTMGLKLFLGGAPAGPAGTGKTETTKDLARALAIPCYVFNCSDQMNFQSMADIFRGLAQTGAWGCFDEFNRIPIEVLSVVATQVKTIQDAIVYLSRLENREPKYQCLPSGTPPVKVGTFDFMGDEISLIPTCGFFITMNPGYAGRTELPENLKALFRSCAMIRPDMKLIQENMLMAEGFQTARVLSVKFNTLYDLSSSLLSKQPHYDWGLRAVKSVLRVAGAMKRANPNLDESQILMRALRDFNTPKIPSHDIPIFLRLIDDLFMGQTVESKVDEDLKRRIIRVAEEQGLQHDETFVKKTCNFQELLKVRHSVMLLGPAGCGKTTIWKTLRDAQNLDKAQKVCVSETVNPKAVTGNELYGYMTLGKDWKDGVLSIIMRGMSKNLAEQGFHDHETSKWIVLDGDIDAVWIESMNTVMDDNKVLTLVSNERIPLSPSMRMVFEINSLKNATPATVSRAGILYINETDIGWRPFVETWVHGLDDRFLPSAKSHLPSLFDRYIEPLIEITRRGYKEVTTIRVINKIQTIVYLLESLLPTIPDHRATAESIEAVFAFSAMWAFGGPMVVNKSADYRRRFSEAFSSLFGAKHLVSKDGGNSDSLGPGICFDYFFDVNTGQHVHWKTKLGKFVPPPMGNRPGETPFSSIFVQTVESTRMSFLLDKLIKNGKYAMLVGNTGTGKTEIIKNYLQGLEKDADDIINRNIGMSYYTSSYTLQMEMEGHIDKRSGSYYGPPMGKTMVFFVDDMNLPQVETYGTQNAIALLTQHMQHGSIFDRADLGSRKELVDIHYVAAMNPTAGSFEICERCQRHFATFAISMPSESDVSSIYTSLLRGHLFSFQPVMQDLTDKIVQCALQVQNMVSNAFLPSAVNFMYNWNLRDLSNIFQGLCLARLEYFTQPKMLANLYIHETQRVYTDRFVSEKEVCQFNHSLAAIVEKNLGQFETAIAQVYDQEDVTNNNSDAQGDSVIFDDSSLVHTNFVATTGDRAYLPLSSYEKLKLALEARLNEYNESNAIMDLVLFKQAMLHVTRISRIIQNPAGNAMLIGVGGSGKQSLCRLAAYINDFEVRQLPISSTFKVEDLLDELRDMYISTGVKGNRIVFLVADSDIVDEEFLVYINAILTRGWIPNLLSKENIDNALGSIASSAKVEGIPDVREARLAYLMSRVRCNLRIVLAFSPVGDIFRVRARRFPGLVNCTAIDQFHTWPRDALISVAERFIADLDISPRRKTSGDNEPSNNTEEAIERTDATNSNRRNLAIHMAEQHLSVARMSKRYLETQQRYNYVTPKSYLELISFFKYLLGVKRTELQRLTERLDMGLSTLHRTSVDVTELQKDLKVTLERVEEKKVATDALIVEMKERQEEAKIQQEAASVEAENANTESNKAAKIEKEAEQELSEAKPAMEAAAAAVDCLSKNMLSELKGLPKPPAGVDKVTNACLILVEKEHNPKRHTWARAKVMMQNVDAFKGKLSEFRGEEIKEQEVGLLKKYVEDAGFTPEKMASKSAAAANLCTWVVNIYAFNRIYVKVKPLMDCLDEARKSKAAALASLEGANAEVASVQNMLKDLGEKYDRAIAEKKEVEEQAANLMTKANLAQRLVGGLASENVRWGEEIEKLRMRASTLTGDCMLAAGFVSYLGAFDQELREHLWKKEWKTDLESRRIPVREGSTPLDLLSDESEKTGMITEGLPSDQVSMENGAILTKCKRWPLIIDPQSQGIKWLKKKEEGNLDVIQVTQKKWLKTVEKAIQNGRCVIIENVGSEIDASLGPILSRSIYKRGRSLYLKIGEEEIEYDPAFQLYLQTNLSNPHFRPEVAAQCTIINFIATEQGLEDQLLAKVVEIERKDLEDRLTSLSKAAVDYQIQLVGLEDNLLQRLADAPEDILSDVALIEGLESTKRTAKEISQAVQAGKAAQEEVKKAREQYRPQAEEGAMLYFLLTKLSSMDHMYRYSLDSFMTFFKKSMVGAERKKDNIVQHVASLRDSLRLTIFTWVSRGLFERHKLIFLAKMTFDLLKRDMIPTVGGGSSDWKEDQFQFLLRAPIKSLEPNPLPWLPNTAWEAISALCELEEFAKFGSDLLEAAPRFKEWFNSAAPENEKLPLDWAALDKAPFQKLLVVRSLRPDRMTVALSSFLRTTLPGGSSYVDCDATLNSGEILEQCLLDSTPTTPIYFILSPGANVVADLDVMASDHGLEKGVSYHNVSMGQGQDTVAMSCLEMAHRNGHWVLLNNVHLMPKWLLELEKKLNEYASEGSHEKFRIFLTSDPSNTIPIGILSRCIKITNEPPSGLRSNLKRAWCFFSKEYVEDMDSKTKSILFGLCFFHSVMMERKMFGPMGFNMKYPFSIGDLRDSATCLQNYMDNISGGKIPWDDLRYIFGEIMYGGHIVNDYDRLVAKEYLSFLMKDELLDETEMYPYSNDEEFKSISFISPAPTSFSKYLHHIDAEMTQDTPVAFGLHPNAEIDFRVKECRILFETLTTLQAGSTALNVSISGEENPATVAGTVASDLLGHLADKGFDMEEIIRSLDEVGPYQNVFLQEMETLTRVLAEIKRSLQELKQGLRGELTMSESMEQLQLSLCTDSIPSSWRKCSWESRRSLASFWENLEERLGQLEEWATNPSDLPRVVHLDLLVKPESFLTSICQVEAKRIGKDLDALCTFTEVKKEREVGDIEEAPRDGAYVTGLWIEGASMANAYLQKARRGRNMEKLPILHIRAIRKTSRRGGIHNVPLYLTRNRGAGFVGEIQIKTKAPSAKWTLAGLAAILDPTN